MLISSIALVLLHNHFNGCVASSGDTRFDPAEKGCQSPIYCYGHILHHVQTSGLFLDSKKFVDMPGKYSEKEILARFSFIDKDSKCKLAHFLAENFYSPGWEIRPFVPKDWRPDPEFLKNITDHNLSKFALKVHEKWKSLFRVVDKSKICSTCANTTISLPFPFVVPGGRFRELYYWDSFWILEGLFVSGMCESAGYIIENFKWLIDKYGFIPNGSREYYLNRSQPPLFTMMVERFCQECVPKEERSAWIRKVLPFMDKEYQFWLTYRKAVIKNTPAEKYILSKYNANTFSPRPESYLQDVVASGKLLNSTQKGRHKFYKDIATSAESGWDFSMRWFRDPNGNLLDIATSDIVPLDLNVILLRNEIILKEYHSQHGSQGMATIYEMNSRRRKESIDLLLKRNSSWSDFDLTANSTISREDKLLIADMAAFWYGDFDYSEGVKALNRYESLIFGFPGGVPANAVTSGEQWDFPNVWAPIQYHTINFLTKLSNICPYPEKKSFYMKKALDVAQRFVDSAYCGYYNYGQFFEKYHAQLVGQPGGGGEYIVQDGFGWTNGVLLWIINNFHQNITLPKSCPVVRAPAAGVFDSSTRSFLASNENSVRRSNLASLIFSNAALLFAASTAVIFAIYLSIKSL